MTQPTIPGPRCRLAVCGSRSLNDERVKILLLEEIDIRLATEIVTHAEPGGVCLVARKLCKEKAIPLKLHFLNFKFLRGAWEHRTREVFNDCDCAIFIHDGKSKGTANELKIAKRMGLPITQHHLEEAPFDASVGFDIITDWDIADVANSADCAEDETRIAKQ